MLYAAENKRKTLAGLLAAIVTLAIGFGLGQASDPSPPNLTGQLAAARQQLGHERAASLTAAGQLASAQRTITQLHATISRQQAHITQLQHRPDHRKRRR